MTTEYFGPLQDPAFGIGDRFDYDRFKRWIEGQPLSFKRSLSIQGDLISTNWNSNQPLDLQVIDSAATEGYALDGSEGAVQFTGAVYIGTSDDSIRINSTAAGYLEFYKGGSLKGNISGQSTALVLASDSVDLHLISSTNGEHVILQSVGDEIRLDFSDQGTGYQDGQVTTRDGSASKPAYSFIGDGDTGMYHSGPNQVALGSDGTVGLIIDQNQRVRVPDGTEGLPAIAFINDNDTGFGRSGTNALAFMSGGTAVFEIAAGIRFYNEAAYNDTTGAAANAVLSSGGGTWTAAGRSQRSTSALKYKSELEDADWLADIELRPMKFYREDDERYYYGFIADWLGDQDELLGEYLDGEIENYDQRAVMAVMAAKINRLEKRLA